MGMSPPWNFSYSHSSSLRTALSHVIGVLRLRDVFTSFSSDRRVTSDGS